MASGRCNNRPFIFGSIMVDFYIILSGVVCAFIVVLLHPDDELVYLGATLAFLVHLWTASLIFGYHSSFLSRFS